MENLIMFIQDNKKKVIAILIILAILIIIVIKNNINKKDVANKEETNYAPVVEMTEDEIQRQKDLELRGGDPWALPNENLVSNEEVITEVH